MPSPSRSSGLPRLLLALGVLAVLGLAAGFWSVTRSAKGALARWEQIGLPSPAPRAQSSRLLVRWPPRLQWRGLVWRRPDRFEATCEALEVELRGGALLRGRLQVGRIQAHAIEIRSSAAWIPWFDRALDHAAMPEPRRPALPSASRAISLEIDSLRFAQSRALRVQGWATATRARTWSAVAFARRGHETGGLEARLEGSGAGGVEEWTIATYLAPERTLTLSQRHPAGSPPVRRVFGRDDGGLLSLLLLDRPVEEAPPLFGAIDFEMETSGQDPPRGEVRIEHLGPRGGAEGDWSLSGALCLADRLLSSEDLTVRSRGGEVRLALSQPIETGTTGSWAASGRLGEEPFEATGKSSFASGAVQAEIVSLRYRRDLRAPITLRYLLRDPATGAAALDGQCRIGGGELRARWDAGRAIRVTAVRLPLGEIAPWVPVTLPGRWSGRLDGEAWADRSGGDLRLWGRTEISQGRVRDLALLEEVESFWGEGERDAGLPVERLTARWLFARGDFLAETLTVAVPTLRAAGSLYRSAADSLSGWLRLSPRGSSSWGSIFLLLGGDEEAIDLSVSGTLRRPAVAPIGAGARRALIERLRGIASGFPAPPNGSTPPS